MTRNPIPLHQLAQKIYNVPQLITPDVAQIINNVMAREIGSRAGWESRDADLQVFAPVKANDGSAVVYAPRASGFVGTTPRDPMTGAPAPYKVSGGTAIIRIVGELVNRGEWVDAESGLVSYEGIKHQCATAGKDDLVKNVVIDMRTPGGEAEGCFSCATAIRDLAAIKPVVCFVNGLACSAGYAIASACTKIVSIPEGRVGSIGVLLMHVDYSVALQLEGIKPTFLFAGSHKTDGNPCTPLLADVQARFQAMIDQTYGMFVATVAAGRKGLSEDAIRATQALVYSGADALALGLIDSIGTFEDLLIELAQPPDSVTVNVTGDDDEPDDDELTAKQGAASPTNTGMLADAAATEADMDTRTFKGKLATALKAVGLDGVISDESASTANGEVASVQMFQEATLKSLNVHYSKVAGDVASCGKAADGEQGTTDLNMVTCGDCLRKEIARAEEAASGAPAIDAAAIIETAADNFMATHCGNAGKDTSAAIREIFVYAKTKGDDAMLARIETVAAGFPKRTTARVDTSNVPDAAKVAGVFGNPTELHLEALARVRAAGLTENSPDFNSRYQAERSAILKEVGSAAA